MERFYEKVNKEGSDTGIGKCWQWTAGGTKNGYGRFRMNDRLFMAHRVSYEINVGPIPPGLHIDHLCRNRACFNPAHLEAVTQAENTARGEAGVNQRSKTHCPRGHEYTGDNVGTRKNGDRWCRACARVVAKNYRLKSKPYQPLDGTEN